MTSLTLAIEGMSCGHCLNAVNRALATVPGVTIKSVRIGQAVVECQPDHQSEQIVAALAAAGYRATPVDL